MSRRAPALVAIVLATIVSTGAAAYAYFTDTAFMSTGTSSTGVVTSQAAPSCSSVVLTSNIRLTWTQVNARYGYAWELRNATTSAVVASGSVGSGVAAGQPVTLDITPTQAGSNGVFTVVVRARLASNTAWVASTATSTPVRRQTVLVNTMYCGAA